MIDSVPLIQNPNDAQQINASIIAMKKASRELDEKIVKLNSLNSELDKKIAFLDSGLNKEIEDRKEAINSLDVSSVGGSGKYISAISETDGKISATASDITSSVSSGNSQPVTSGGVADAIQGVISLPTDAVLHYSFDEVPDYPDGTSDVRLLNNTYDIQSTNYQFRVFRTTTITNSNGNALLTISSSTDGQSGVFIQGSYFVNKIVKIKIKINSMTTSIDISNGKGTSGVVAERFTTLGIHEFTLLQNNSAQYPNVYITTTNANESANIEILAVYIGDGSYSTPIIDNANGQNNATNNGGIAVNGVSGKGAYFLNGKYANIGTDFQLNPNFTVSVWVNPDNNNMATGDIFAKYGQFILRNGSNADWGMGVLIYLYGANSTLIQGARPRALLPPKEWTHLTCVRNELEFILYVNGVKSWTKTISDNTLAQNSNPLTICGSSSITNTRPQSVDDLLIFDRALTEAEVQALYLNKANTPKYYSWADWKLSNT